MATIFDIQEEYGKALACYQQAFNGRESTLGKDHPLALTTVYNMASVFFNSGEYGEALKWCQRALDCHEKTPRRIHYSTLHAAYCIQLERIRQWSSMGPTSLRRLQRQIPLKYLEQMFMPPEDRGEVNLNPWPEQAASTTNSRMESEGVIPYTLGFGKSVTVLGWRITASLISQHNDLEKSRASLINQPDDLWQTTACFIVSFN